MTTRKRQLRTPSMWRVIDTRTMDHAGDYEAETAEAAIAACIVEVGEIDVASIDPDDYEASEVSGDDICDECETLRRVKGAMNHAGMTGAICIAREVWEDEMGEGWQHCSITILVDRIVSICVRGRTFEELWGKMEEEVANAKG